MKDSGHKRTIEGVKCKLPKYFSVNNFDRHQHYKLRRPPWIKLYSELLDDPAFVSLPLKERYVYCALLLLASRLGNHIPYDMEYLQNALQTKEEINLSALFSKGFLLAQSRKPTLSWSRRSGHTQSQSRDRKEAETQKEGEVKEGEKDGFVRKKSPLTEEEREQAEIANLELMKKRAALGIDADRNKD